MSAKVLIINRFAGLVIPEAYLAKATKEYNSYIGVAFAADGQVQVSRSVTNDEQKAELATSIMELQTDPGLAPHNMLIALGKDKVPQSSDMQPFVLSTSGKEKTQLVAFMQGNFPKHVKDNPMSAAFHASHSYLFPKFSGMLRMLKDDLKLFGDELRQDYTKADMLGLLEGQGQITLMLADGQVLTYPQNDTLGEYDWGWTSDHLGFTEGIKGGSKPAETKKANGLFAGLKAFATGNKQEAAPEQTEPVIGDNVPAAEPGNTENQNDVVQPEAPQTDTAVGKTAVGQLKGRPPAHKSSKNDKKGWYGKFSAETPACPAQFKNRPFVAIKPEYYGSTEVEWEKPMAQAMATATNTAAAKDTATKNLPEGVHKLSEPAVATEDLPIIPAAQKDFIIKKWLKDGDVIKALDRNSNPLLDFEELKALESKLPKFYQQAGLGSLEELDGIRFSSLVKLGKGGDGKTGGVEALATLARDWHYALMEARVTVNKHMQTIAKLTGVGEETVDTKKAEKPTQVHTARKLAL